MFRCPNGITPSELMDSGGGYPGLRARELPWDPSFQKAHQPRMRLRPFSWLNVPVAKWHNSFGVDGFGWRLPKVARSSQPWALLQNPFGIRGERQRDCRS